MNAVLMGLRVEHLVNLAQKIRWKRMIYRRQRKIKQEKEKIEKTNKNEKEKM